MTVGRDGSAPLFRPVLDILTQMKRSGDLFIALSPPLVVSFEVDRAILRQYLEGSGVSDKEFRAEANEISVMLLAVLEDQIEDYAHRRLAHRNTGTCQ